MTWNVFRPKALKTSGTSFFFRTYDGEDERVGEVSVERELHHVPPQPQQLHRLSQTHEDVTTRSRKQQRRGNTGNTHQDFHLQFKINVSDPDWFTLNEAKTKITYLLSHTGLCLHNRCNRSKTDHFRCSQSGCLVQITQTPTAAWRKNCSLNWHMIRGERDQSDLF